MPDNRDDWHLYLIRCRGGQLYTGITTNVARRFDEHCEGKGAKFLRGKGPLQLEFSERIGTQSEALKAEIRVKKMRKIEKEAVIRQGSIA